jgi:oligoribonuclease NrnB/cAMP/cGMP phosphodiesterase (DHH superfamily)
MEIKNIIYFHYPCTDGLASAWVATQNLKNYKLKPYQHGHTIPTDYSGKTIYFLDMAPPVEVYQKLIVDNTVYIIDHHISNQKEYQKFCDENNISDPNVFFDLEHSGVGMTWIFFTPDKKMPVFLEMIQGRDLWKFDIENTNEFCEALSFAISTVETIDDQLKIFDEIYKKNLLEKYISTGKIMLKQKNIRIKHLASKYIKKIYIYESHKVCMANEPEYSSDLGNALSSQDQCDFAVIWKFDHISEKYIMSLRSCDKVDVSVICKKFGGGGHKNAAGCSSSIHPIVLFNQE